MSRSAAELRRNRLIATHHALLLHHLLLMVKLLLLVVRHILRIVAVHSAKLPLITVAAHLLHELLLLRGLLIEILMVHSKSLLLLHSITVTHGASAALIGAVVALLIVRHSVTRITARISHVIWSASVSAAELTVGPVKIHHGAHCSTHSVVIASSEITALLRTRLLRLLLLLLLLLLHSG